MKRFTKGLLAVLIAAFVAGNGFAGAKQEPVAASLPGFAAEVSREVVPLERNGIQLYLARYQPTDSGAKTPILLVHGLTYSSHEFDVDYADYSLVRYLANNGYAVWLIDIAGYGSSQKVTDGFQSDSDYAAEDIAAAARKIAESAGVEKIDVLGWSWGTVTSGRFAAKYPELVSKLVLYAPIVAGLGDYAVPDPFHANDWAHAADDFQKTADGSIDFTLIEPAVANTYLANSWRYDGAGSPAGGRRDLLVAATERLIPTANITAPTLLILGDKDPYVSVDLAKEALATLPNGEIKVINGAAHAVMMEKPYYKEFRETVLAFLKK
jgi:pimeloyl-ACP methyl ester carboxylesterase